MSAICNVGSAMDHSAPLTLCDATTSFRVTEAPTNFFGGSPLNRLAWLRTSEPFLHAIVEHQSTRWIVFQAGNPLLCTPEGSKRGKIARLSTADVRPLLGAKPYFAQGQTDGELAESGIAALEAARIRGPGIVFLGLHEHDPESSEALPSSDFSKKDAITVAAKIKGDPYFSLDVTGLDSQEVQEVLRNAEANKAGDKLSFGDTRAAMTGMDDFEGGVIAEARAMVDWNARNKVRLVHYFLRSGSRSITGRNSVLCCMWITCVLVVGWVEVVMHLTTAVGRPHREVRLPDCVSISPAVLGHY